MSGKPDNEAPLTDGLVLRICRGLSCSRHSEAIEAAARAVIEKRGLAGTVAIAHEACFGRCFAGPNILVERWRDGRANEQAQLTLMMGLDHPDLRFEQGVIPDDLPGLVRRHLRAYRRDRDGDGEAG